MFVKQFFILSVMYFHIGQCFIVSSQHIRSHTIDYEMVTYKSVAADVGQWASLTDVGLVDHR